MPSFYMAPQAKDAFVAFLDVLGFSAMMRDKEKWEGDVDRIFSAIEHSVAELRKEVKTAILPQNELKSIVVSDSIILWIVPDVDGDKYSRLKALRYLLHAVEKIQFDCARQDIWMRGGISFGKIKFTNSNIAGPGYLKALDLEKSAIYPRVLVDAKMIRDLTGSKNIESQLTSINQTFHNPHYSGKFIYQFSELERDLFFKQDYPYFVHYLNRLSDDPEHVKVIWDHVRKNIFATTPSIFQKYKWVEEYIRTSSVPGGVFDYFFENQI